MGSLSLRVSMVSVDVKQHWNWNKKFQNPYPEKKEVPIMIVMRTQCPDWYITKLSVLYNIGLSETTTRKNPKYTQHKM